MEQTIRMTGGRLAALHTGRTVATARTSDPDLPVPPRGGEPKSIGQLMEPLQRIIAHPDRNRLMAKFFRDNW